MSIKRVYIAGPYTGDTRWEQEENVRRAEAMGYQVALLGAYPVIPHANTRHYFSDAQPPTFWYEATMDELQTCHALMMVPGWSSSKGAKAEKAEAERLGIPVFIKIRDLNALLGELPD